MRVFLLLILSIGFFSVWGHAQVVLPAYQGVHHPGFACGKDSITDYDGNKYATVQIGEQCWMAENLAVTHYPDGTPISHITDNNEWANLEDNNTDDAYCFYNNNSGGEADIYGALYTWAAAMGDNATSSSSNPSGVQGACPDGWHLPSDEEWKELEMALGMTEAEANSELGRGQPVGSMLAGSASLWDAGLLVNDTEFNTSGFMALPGGHRKYNTGEFKNLNSNGWWWSTTEHPSNGIWRRRIRSDYSGVLRSMNYQSNGLSVRCVKD